ncbi:MAG: acyl-CoA dehydrogenase, partial [Verrucomicrobia bacterium]|nr:acyl-CoA dehydrogenase [Verrucomicrobiota bacterium]
RVVLEDATVSKDQLLGEAGKGAYIAFNILNFGRFGLGAGAVGASKDLLRVAARYAGERSQFGKTIGSFGLIQQKLGHIAAKIYAAESAVYRTAAMIDAVMETGELMDSMNPAFPRGLDEFALECSIIKVACSETLDRAADETLQIHGGYGYTEEFPAARAYRDSRINRIFEGTNEINRLFIPGLLMRRSQRGRFPLMPAVAKIVKELFDLAAPEEFPDPLRSGRSLLANAKKVALFLSGAAYQKFGEKLIDQQEVLAGLSDLIIDIYLAESAVLRAQKHAGKADASGSHATLAAIAVNDAATRMENTARATLASWAEGDELKTQLGIVKRLLRWTPLNATALKRKVAQRLSEVASYPALLRA